MEFWDNFYREKKRLEIFYHDIEEAAIMLDFFSLLCRSRIFSRVTAATKRALLNKLKARDYHFEEGVRIQVESVHFGEFQGFDLFQNFQGKILEVLEHVESVERSLIILDQK